MMVSMEWNWENSTLESTIVGREIIPNVRLFCGIDSESSLLNIQE